MESIMKVPDKCEPKNTDEFGGRPILCVLLQRVEFDTIFC